MTMVQICTIKNGSITIRTKILCSTPTFHSVKAITNNQFPIKLLIQCYSLGKDNIVKILKIGRGKLTSNNPQAQMEMLISNN
jgi:hypothetical protein